MSVEEKLRVVADRIRTHSSAMLTEEALKTAIILPFLSALDYDVFNPDEVIPEFCADAVGKKGEKVDYAIKLDGEIRILIECKPISMALEKVHLAQLYRYFSVTNAKFAILTNGRTFHFHTDLVAPNRLDDRPFLTFDLSDMQGQLVTELKKFAKAEFNIDGILQSAHRLKYTSAIKKEIANVMENPPEDFVRMVTGGLYQGRFTSQVKEQFTPMVKAAFREIVRESVQSRLSTALAETEVSEIGVEGEETEEVVTTEEEREGFMIIRAIVRDTLKPARVVMRDQKSYCGILIDNNNRKPLARLWFNRSIRYLGLFDGEKENKVKIDTLDEIYDYSDRLRATAKEYTAPVHILAPTVIS
ncbi:type I restriction enzyme HsdR N-terminal domain-containing protein [Mesorhizobium sp. BR1-1-13]|uniref:type I restriction enzyme HsdR N-terminal domain-containing protein n=1 Tax=Mesorhizobium sp. BR1-1-13 TaxID=2876656 RepID=UPI001CD124A1|nr:type I restriction enzyme HsdR N-terminal domain-containing protein [Mesorhizobium sp. BR1-1-13]MBZ9942563.1 type I restriction enzyme HsdR N-terminal domain-containing protein [Mesorhizobium sp. BR1-1-13]